MITRKSVLAGAAICILGVGVIVLLNVAEHPGEQGGSPKDSVLPSQSQSEAMDAAELTSQKSPADTEHTKGEVDKADSAHQSQLRNRLNELKISPHVRTIIGLDGSDLNSRRSAMKKLTRNLPQDDIKALKSFLDFRYKDNSSERLLVFEGLKNDALDVLLRQENLPEGIGIRLVKMFSDSEHSDVWRDYCIQYLAPYYQRKWPAGKQLSDDPERKTIEQAYWDATAQADRSFAGTALIGLDILSRTFTNIPRNKVEESAVRIATDDSAAEPARITALVMASSMGRREVLPEARILAQIGETTTLRMAAIAALGKIGDKSDIELVRSLIQSRKKRIQRTAESALEKLSARTEQNKSNI